MNIKSIILILCTMLGVVPMQPINAMEVDKESQKLTQINLVDLPKAVLLEIALRVIKWDALTLKEAFASVVNFMQANNHLYYKVWPELLEIKEVTLLKKRLELELELINYVRNAQSSDERIKEYIKVNPSANALYVAIYAYDSKFLYTIIPQLALFGMNSILNQKTVESNLSPLQLLIYFYLHGLYSSKDAHALTKIFLDAGADPNMGNALYLYFRLSLNDKQLTTMIMEKMTCTTIMNSYTNISHIPNVKEFCRTYHKCSQCNFN